MPKDEVGAGLAALGALGYTIRVLTENRSVYTLTLPAMIVRQLFRAQADGRYYVELQFDQKNGRIIIGMPLFLETLEIEEEEIR